MDYVQIKLEIICPGDNVSEVRFRDFYTDLTDPTKKRDFVFPIPKIRKLVLTEETEIALWGDVKHWRKYLLTPLWNHDGYRESIGFLSEEQTEIYNNRKKSKYNKNPEKYFVEPGLVRVIQRESAWDIELKVWDGADVPMMVRGKEESLIDEIGLIKYFRWRATEWKRSNAEKSSSTK